VAAFSRKLFREVLSGGDLDGMTARFSLLVWPDRNEEFVYVDRQPNHQAEHETDQVFKKLLSLEPAAFFGPYDPRNARAFRFDDAAQEIFIEWYTQNQKHVRKDKEPDGLTAHFSKYAGLFPRLAIVHHLIRHALKETASPILVDAETAAGVESFIDNYLEPHARRIYRHLGGDPLRDNARRIATWFVADPTMTTFKARDIRRKQWSGLTEQDDVNKALDYLENVAGWVRCVNDLSGPRGGRPSYTFRINPMVQR